MSVFPESVLHQLEFQDIRQWLHNKCHSEGAKQTALALSPSNKYHEYTIWLQQLKEYSDAIANVGYFPSVPHYSFSGAAERLKITGAVLELQEIVSIRSALIYLYDWDKYFSEIKSDKFNLKELRLKVSDLAPAKTAIEKVLDQNNEVFSNASPRLKKIRERKSELVKLLDKTFQQSLRKAANSNFLAETQESHIYGRRVLSVLVEKKRQLKGSILGYSRNANIAYMEPESTIALNDELDNLHNEERAEIHKIFSELCKSLAPFSSALLALSNFVEIFDLMQAKHALAKRMDANLPQISKQLVADLKTAYHPTLYLKNLDDGRFTMPNNICLTEDKRVMVISGPNAGGKSIALKTIGLQMLMLYSGLFVPCDAESQFGSFDKIFTDIGDNQSIEDELSTYSHKLKSMTHILQNSSKSSIVLIDEFGSGTDPSLGGAIAEVFLEEVYKRKSFVLLTTHYNNIKIKADTLPEAMNASMQFDLETLQPKYKLISGVAGQSFTFEVARNAGFPNKLIQRAGKYAGKDKMSFENSIQQIEQERKQLKNMQQKLNQLQSELEKEKSALERKDKQLLQHAEKRSVGEIDNEKWLRLGKNTEAWLLKLPIDNKKQQLHGSKMIEALKDIRKEYLSDENNATTQKKEVKTSVKSGAMPERIKKQPETIQRPIVVGSLVRLLDSNTTGKVMAIEKKKAKVQFGHLHSMVKLELLNLIQ
jgi:DNA mismatch repair protein MutS2